MQRVTAGFDGAGGRGRLRVHTSPRADVLVDALADVLADVPPGTDPFAREVVAVPTRGVERWVAQRLSHRLGAGPDGEAGVCARIDFDPPARLVRDAVAAARTERHAQVEGRLRRLGVRSVSVESTHDVLDEMVALLGRSRRAGR